ncbi:excalibur calcium-binding domain-containing protein [Sagittula sp. SSi028]|uniref:excalibur calcium-binding domain-containing protein n=1 Tax=Sagittula sp. SSi028 TaxID=3400636 RepID=UPI003AF6504C
MTILKLALVLGLMAGAASAAPQTAHDLRTRLDSFRTAQAFDCRNVSCKRLRSCAEACFKLHQCGQTVRDGDNDGIPCENLCRSRC